MASTATTGPAERVRDYKHVAPTGFAGETWYGPADGRAAYDATSGVCIANALASIEAGDTAEAMAWSNIALAIGFRYRKDV